MTFDCTGILLKREEQKKEKAKHGEKKNVVYSILLFPYTVS